jgi:hypothetical protein
MNLEFLAFLPAIPYERAFLGYAAGIIVSIVATGYAIQIYREHLHVNIATWAMILLIDILGLSLAFSTGNQNPYIHIAWVVTDVLICIAALAHRTNWHWSLRETISLILFLASLYLWQTSEAVLSVVGYLVACFFTLLPQALQYWHDKRLARKSAWIWIMNSVALVMTILSLDVITLEYSVATLGLLVLNLAMVMIALK